MLSNSIIGAQIVSINSTSEEVRSCFLKETAQAVLPGFPLIQLPRKSEEKKIAEYYVGLFEFPLIQLPRKSEEEIIHLINFLLKEGFH